MTRKTVRICDLKTSVIDSDEEDFYPETATLIPAMMFGTRRKQSPQTIGGGLSGYKTSDERTATSPSTVYNVSQEHQGSKYTQVFPRVDLDDEVTKRPNAGYNTSPLDQGSNFRQTQRTEASRRTTPDEGIATETVSPSDQINKFLTKSRSAVFTPPDFDVLFKNPAKLHFEIKGESIDEGIHSFDSGTSHVYSSFSRNNEADDISTAIQKPPPPKRSDSVMVLTFTDMVVKNWENSQGLAGFRHKLANDINHKYCSYCRCDDMIFIFLYVVFGLIYICAGTLGLTQCSSELYVNIFLITDGLLSVFVFPITIMEWTKRIGGCVKKNDVQGHGVTFILIVILRIAAAVSGSVIIAMRINVYPEDNFMCWTVFRLLEVGVVLEWAFLLFVMLLPLVLCTAVYFVARKL
ncbi:uncharacterized protein LOC123523452 [Mercenaria mercenaria]|uniref:uncharacterized protein LOC123523452 n=1 Tax=Mercenaria mercenaria TaxID=6596 RepID=UPI00234EFE01|nr:uncharacterized protein LOC123523452 [Mercenaria mercenaria]